jgi:hypothetical protein
VQADCQQQWVIKAPAQLDYRITVEGVASLSVLPQSIHTVAGCDASAGQEDPP